MQRTQFIALAKVCPNKETLARKLGYPNNQIGLNKLNLLRESFRLSPKEFDSFFVKQTK